MLKPNERSTAAGPYSSANGTAHKWLGGWGGIALCMLVIVGAVLAFSGGFDGGLTAGALLPLLFVLPCALMMFMCMKNMGDSQSGADNSSVGTDAQRTSNRDQR